jgi:hypothetical protein
MSVIVIATTPGMDAAAYDRTVGTRTGMPPGCTAHHAGPVEGGWRVVSVWDSAEQAQKFGRTVLAPALAAEGLTPTPPEIAALHASRV